MPAFDADALVDTLRALDSPFVEEALTRLEAAPPETDPLPQTAEEMAARIDHTLLNPEATPAQVRSCCEEARRYGFASACVQPSFVPLAAEGLAESPSAVCTVIGFPHGATLTEAKVAETEAVCRAGADEVDMVLAIGRLKGAEYEAVRRDIAAVVEAAGSATVKVILETSLLTDAEKALACLLVQQAGAHFVKTATGFAGGGATIPDVALMRQMVGDRLGVKASGGVRSFDDACAMIEAGANRIGASGSIGILEGAPKGGGSALADGNAP